MAFLVAFVALGGLIAVGHSAALAYDVGLYVRPGATAVAVVVHVLRSVGLVLAFVAIALLAPRGLAAAVTGFALTQLAVVAVARRRSSPAERKS